MDVEPINQLADDVLFVVDMSRDAESLSPPWPLAESLLRSRGLDGAELYRELSKLAMVDVEIRAIRFEARRRAIESERRAQELRQDLDRQRRASAPRI